MALFNIYTYQFKPIFDHPTLFDDVDWSPDKAMEQKNIFFAAALKEVSFVYRNKKHNIRFIISNKNFFIFRIDNARKIRIEKDFKVSEDTDQPSTLVIIDNDKNVQRIAIEENLNTFAHTDTVAHIIEESVKYSLKEHFLEISIRREYSRNEFWDLVRLYENNISTVTFKFDYPNLPRVRALIPEMLKDASKKTRSTKTSLKFEADKGQSLHLNRDDYYISGLADGASDCGSKIKIGIKGFKKQVETGFTNKQVEFDELNIEGNIDNIRSVLKNINE